VIGTTTATFPMDIAEKKERIAIELEMPARMAKKRAYGNCYNRGPSLKDSLRTLQA